MLHFLLLLQLQAKAEAENSEVAANTTDKMTLVSTLKLFLQSGPIETKWNRYVHQWVKLWRVWGSGKKEESMICMICYKFWEISEMSVSDLLYIWDWKVEPDKDTRWLKPQRGMWGWYKKLSRVNVKKKGRVTRWPSHVFITVTDSSFSKIFSLYDWEVVLFLDSTFKEHLKNFSQSLKHFCCSFNSDDKHKFFSGVFLSLFRHESHLLPFVHTEKNDIL